MLYFILRMWNIFEHSLTCVNYKLLINVYLNGPNKIYKPIKLASQLIQGGSRDRSGKDNIYF